MKTSSRWLAGLVAASLFVQGCSSGDGGRAAETGEGREAPKRPPRLATLYVESSGEPLHAGGRKVEKADEAGEAKGEFSAKDLLMPGMFVLVSGATALGGPLLIKALDKKDRPSGPSYVASGGDDGTYVPAEISSGGATGASAGGPAAEPGAGGPTEAPDPGGAVATAGDAAGPGARTLASGHGIVATPTSILLSMGYASDFSGPSYIKGKLGSAGTATIAATEVHVYRWTLTVSSPETGRGGRVDVYATFSGLPADAVVLLWLDVAGNATFTCDRTPLVKRIPPGGLKDEWIFSRFLSFSVYGHPDFHARIGGKLRYGLMFRLKTPGVPVRLGYLTVEGETEILGESVAEVTVH